MADSIYTFYPQFKEFLPLYRDVTRVWLGDGSTTGTDGMLYAEYADGHVAELGSVSMYPVAVAHGYTGTEAEWIQSMISVAAAQKGATVVTEYINSNSGASHPSDTSNWTTTPSPEKGKYLWARATLTWADNTTSKIYTVSYIGADGGISSVNGLTGEVVLTGENINIYAGDTTTVKQYIDDAVTNMQQRTATATDQEIDSLFA